jgi:hypothetical protein
VAYINPNTLDNGLSALKAAADRVFITSAEATTWTELSSTYKLGTKTFAAGSVFPAAIATDGTGRKIVTAVISDGAVEATGTASHWGVGTSGSTRLEVAQSLASSQSVTNGNQFSLTAADVKLAGAS